jgi:hypothetical protein
MAHKSAAHKHLVGSENLKAFEKFSQLEASKRVRELFKSEMGAKRRLHLTYLTATRTEEFLSSSLIFRK